MIVGLGNPGVEYADTRHNIGFKVIDSLAGVSQGQIRKRKFGGYLGQIELGGQKLILLKPWRFMNLSGGVVARAMAFYKLDVGDLLVITDDMALPVGAIRLRAKGSAGGHNGLADIIEKLGTEDFARCRVGIGRSEADDDVDYVLSRPGEPERLLLVEAIERAREAVICWFQRGLEAAMNEFNG